MIRVITLGNIASYTAPGEGTVAYTYDALGQLLSATGNISYTYTYDAAGNILTANGHSYTYGNSEWKDLLTAYDGQAISYDAIGNPISYCELHSLFGQRLLIAFSMFCSIIDLQIGIYRAEPRRVLPLLFSVPWGIIDPHNELGGIA